MVRRLVARGITVCLASGRGAPEVEHVLQALALPTSTHCVLYNGGLGMTCPAYGTGWPGSGVPFYEATLSRSDTDAALAFASGRGLLVQYYQRDAIYTACRNDAQRKLADQYIEITGQPHVDVDEFYAAAIEKGLPPKLLLMTEDPDAIVEAAQQEFVGRDLYIVRGSPPFFVEILAPGVNKGTGFLRLCEHLGVKPESCVAFGDGDNDLEMLQYAGLGIAMCNGRDNAKQAADRVSARPNVEDGVAHEIESLESDGLFVFLDVDKSDEQILPVGFALMH